MFFSFVKIELQDFISKSVELFGSRERRLVQKSRNHNNNSSSTAQSISDFNFNNNPANRGSFGFEQQRVPRPDDGQLAAVHVFRIFHSEGPVKDLLFTDRTSKFYPLEQLRWNYKKYLGESVLPSFEVVRRCPIAKLTLCITSQPEHIKCIAFRTALKVKTNETLP
jgi:hypothetical protein